MRLRLSLIDTPGRLSTVQIQSHHTVSGCNSGRGIQQLQEQLPAVQPAGNRCKVGTCVTPITGDSVTADTLRGSILIKDPLTMHGTATAQSLLILVQKRSEEHTSELQSRGHLVCRLLLE